MKTTLLLSLIGLTTSVQATSNLECFKKAENIYKQWTIDKGYEFTAFSYRSKLNGFLNQASRTDDRLFLAAARKFEKYPKSSLIFLGSSDYMGGSGTEAFLFTKNDCQFLEYSTVYSD